MANFVLPFRATSASRSAVSPHLLRPCDTFRIKSAGADRAQNWARSGSVSSFVNDLEEQLLAPYPEARPRLLERGASRATARAVIFRRVQEHAHLRMTVTERKRHARSTCCSKRSSPATASWRMKARGLLRALSSRHPESQRFLSFAGPRGRAHREDDIMESRRGRPGRCARRGPYLEFHPRRHYEARPDVTGRAQPQPERDYRRPLPNASSGRSCTCAQYRSRRADLGLA